ncbi:MAG TPA: hypothetical protein VFJ43_09445 [Bacteroidia bacterium]|nr:hypothetical protein [Bacteroidia bacterium]
MILGKDITLKSKLELSELIRRLESVTEKKYTKESNIFKFEGKIEKDKFRILPTSDYSQNDRIRPEIFGVITENEGVRRINLSFKLPSGYIALFIFASIFTIAITSVLFVFSKSLGNIFEKAWWIGLLAIGIFCVASIITLRIRISKSIYILEKVFKAIEE